MEIITNNNLKCDVLKTQGVKIAMPVEIEESLEDIVVNEGDSVVFECKINGFPLPVAVWYRDGQRIDPSNRIRIIADGRWRRIEIDSVTERDHGLYKVLIKNVSSTTFSNAKLYVKPKVKGVLHTCPCPRWSLAVVKQLSSTTVHVGDRIELEVELNTETITDFIWFKSNTPIAQNERTIILNNTTSSALSIHCAKLTDSGIYTIVTKTKYGIVSTTADVQVLDIDLRSIKSEIPILEELLPDEVDANEDEEIRLICKAKYDTNTVIKWFKSGAPITCNKRLIIEQYSGNYIGLRITQASRSDSAEYSVVLENVITGQTDSSTCFLTVNSSPMVSPPIVLLKKPLISTIACCGARVTFDCSFELVDSRYYHVVWYIGHFRVERSNTRFNVVCKDGEFLLNIKKLEPSMAGEVLCELRRVLPNQTSILINSTSAYLSIVPPCVLEEEGKVSFKKIQNPNIYSLENQEDIGIRFTQMPHGNGSNKNGYSENCTPNEILMEIIYSRLEDDLFYYLHVTKKVDFLTTTKVKVREREQAMNRKQVKIIVIEWSDVYLETWYAIDIIHNDHYIEAGVTNSPRFEIKDPPVGKAMQFRIRTAKPLKNVTESSICIDLLKCLQTNISAPTSPNDTTVSKKVCHIKEMDEFSSCFTNTGDVIGCGAFGSVMLVQDKTGEYFAAKFLKTRTQKKRETAQREYEMMKELNHPKLVELIDAFVAKDSFVLVMDYLWGGELFDRIVEEEHIKEMDVVPYVRQICEALEYLHCRKIAHLDLKPENIICLSPNSRQVKLVDFGLARLIEEGHITRAIYGTRDYVAPEVLNFEEITLACDMWSLGVVTYMLLSGVMPFAGDTWPERSANITRANYNYDETAFKDISDLAKDFVDHLLILSAEKRMTAVKALNHRWIVEGPPKGAKAGHMKRARENLKSYLANYRARWQRAGNVMIAAHRLRTQASIRNSAERTSPGT